MENSMWSIYNNIFPYKNYRPMTRFMMKYFKEKKLVGSEIGVSKGTNSCSMLDALPIKKMYLIDPYDPWLDNSPDEGYIKRDYGPHKKIAEKNLKRYRDKCIFITKTSDKAIDDIKDMLDFIYIDGNHTYEYVKKDIELYYPKVKKGGVVGGHDFSAAWGVPKAVIEFAKKQNTELYGWDNDWWIIKK